MGPRVSLSTTLIVGAATLLVAIAVGNALGSRVIGQVTGRISVLSPTPFPVARSVPKESAEAPAWKEEPVMSVATDPGFPDPRVTPEPPPTPKPAPTLELTPFPGPSPKPTRRYTSPPLLVPLSSPSPFSEEQAQTTDSESSATPRPSYSFPAAEVRP